MMNGGIPYEMMEEEMKRRLQELRQLGFVTGVPVGKPASESIKDPRNRGEVRWAHDLVPHFLVGEIAALAKRRELADKDIWWDSQNECFRRISPENVSRRVAGDNPFRSPVIQPAELILLSEMLQYDLVTRCCHFMRILQGDGPQTQLDSDLDLLSIAAEAVFAAKEIAVRSVSEGRDTTHLRNVVQKCLHEKLSTLFRKTFPGHGSRKWKDIDTLDIDQQKPGSCAVWAGQLDGARMALKGFPLWCISVVVGYWE